MTFNCRLTFEELSCIYLLSLSCSIFILPRINTINICCFYFCKTIIKYKSSSSYLFINTFREIHHLCFRIISFKIYSKHVSNFLLFYYCSNQSYKYIWRNYHVWIIFINTERKTVWYQNNVCSTIFTVVVLFLSLWGLLTMIIFFTNLWRQKTQLLILENSFAFLTF